MTQFEAEHVTSSDTAQTSVSYRIYVVDFQSRLFSIMLGDVTIWLVHSYRS
jgi:hypothetical protein